MTDRKIAFMVPKWKQPPICPNTGIPCSCKDSACRCQHKTPCTDGGQTNED